MKTITLSTLKFSKSLFFLIALSILTNFNIDFRVFAKTTANHAKAKIQLEKTEILDEFTVFDQTRCITKHGDKPVYLLERNLKARVTRPDKNFSNWFLFNDKFNSQKFFGSFSIRPRGDEAVSSMIIKLRGTKTNEFKKFYYKPGTLKAGAHVCDLNTKEISCRVFVHPESHTGKTLAVKLRGKITTQ